MVPAGLHIRNKALTRYETTQSFFTLYIFICFSLVCKASQNVFFFLPQSRVNFGVTSNKYDQVKTFAILDPQSRVHFLLEIPKNLKTPGTFLKCLKDLATYKLVQN